MSPSSVCERNLNFDTRRDLQQVIKESFACNVEAERFENSIERWGGPEDVFSDANGSWYQPWVGKQQFVHEVTWCDEINEELFDDILGGTIILMRSHHESETSSRKRRVQPCIDFLMRDHHILDALLLHRSMSLGPTPRALFHADRHSDWCRDGFLLEVTVLVALVMMFMCFS